MRASEFPDTAVQEPFRLSWRIALMALGVAATAALVLWLMGRNPICTCGAIKFWHGSANDSGTSQHLTDWYTPSHIIHGFIFFWLFRHVPARLGVPLPAGLAFVLAMLVESGWEIAENTPMVIDRYRTATVALGYTGDSILNSMADIASMATGYLFARLAPGRLTMAIALAMELLTLAVIRDNLTLNVIMLTWPIEAIRQWQAGA